MHLRPTFRVLGAVSPTLVAVGYSQLNTGSSFSSALNKDNKNHCYVKAGKQSIYLFKLCVYTVHDI